jgi:general secretion pathway protein F
MPVFEYTALNKQGKKKSGIIDADGAAGARQMLRDSKIYPISLRELSERHPKKKKGLEKSDIARQLMRRLSRVKPADISVMTRQLSTLLWAGLPLVSALESLIPQTRSARFKKILAQIKNAIVEGSDFAQALSLYPGVFSALYINMIRSGETAGTLEIVLERLADLMEKQNALASRVKGALYYPVFMAVIGSLVLFALMGYVVPKITSIFTDLNQTLPLPTILLIGASKFIKGYWWLFMILAGGLAYGARLFINTEKGRYSFDKMKLSLPIAGNMIKKLSSSRFFRTLASLLNNGVSMLKSLEIVKNIAGNVLFAEALENVAEEVGKGKGLAESISAQNIFPMLSVQMIQVGEQSGELETMLSKVAEIYEKEVENTITGMTSLLEPIMILFMAVIIGFIVVAIALPIIEMNQISM